MALYLVRAKPKQDLQGLKKELDAGAISRLQPFGEALHYGLENARVDKDHAVWVEEDYCLPPLAMERASVLDRYFDDITVETVDSEQEGWERIENKPRLWK